MSFSLWRGVSATQAAGSISRAYATLSYQRRETGELSIVGGAGPLPVARKALSKSNKTGGRTTSSSSQITRVSTTWIGKRLQHFIFVLSPSFFVSKEFALGLQDNTKCGHHY